MTGVRRPQNDVPDKREPVQEPADSVVSWQATVKGEKKQRRANVRQGYVNENQSVRAAFELSHPGYDDEMKDVHYESDSTDGGDADSPVAITAELDLLFEVGCSVCVVMHHGLAI